MLKVKSPTTRTQSKISRAVEIVENKQVDAASSSIVSQMLLLTIYDKLN